MTSTTSHRSRTTSHRGAALAAAAVLTLSALLAGCSASDSGTNDSSAPQDAPAGAAVDDTGAKSGDEFAASAADDQRQVIQTGDVRMTVDSPQKTAAAIVTLTEKAGGRVDDRTEHAATSQDVGTAELTIRLPASEVSGALDELRTLGTVDEIKLDAQDVTGAAQDLDARIHGLEISVARMEDLLNKATTSADVIAAESALSDRQTNLEQLKSERARLAEQVSLSTLTIALYGPALAPAQKTSGPDSFFDGVAAGWSSLVTVVEALVIVLGVLLPWLVLGGLLAWGIAVLVRRYRRAHPRVQPAPQPQAYQRVPLGVGAPVGSAGPFPGQPPAAPPVHDPDGE
ncbi:DUF4349 domain-containing protein [Cellulomonas sp. URHD0024]|uniref:DUF4349 domain-containing protein n=1 Tax=Cellulomonas sp. URHD0024 TaxID=1302620 RepID=UPI0003F6D2F5|nr:DUF4349 domain-containing protein [Cellulomonas sp. URHD0024]